MGGVAAGGGLGSSVSQNTLTAAPRVFEDPTWFARPTQRAGWKWIGVHSDGGEESFWIDEHCGALCTLV